MTTPDDFLDDISHWEWYLGFRNNMAWNIEPKVIKTLTEVNEIRLKWGEDETSRTLEVIKRLADLEDKAPWYYFKDPKPLKGIVVVLVHWWHEVSTQEEYDLDWPQSKYVAFSGWVKNHISDKSVVYKIMDEYFNRWEIDGELLNKKWFQDYYWNRRSDWHPNEYVPEIYNLRTQKLHPQIKDWIWSKKVGDLATEFINCSSWSAAEFIKEVISHRLGGITVETKFIKKLAKMDELEEEHENKFFTTELLGLFMERDNQRIHFHNPIALDIGTPFMNLSQLMNDNARKQKIRNAKITNIGLHSFSEGGMIIDPKLSIEQRLENLRTELKKSDILIGYNLWDFDLEVLKANGLDVSKEFPNLVIYDIMRAIYGKHSSVRTKLSDLLLENGLPEKDSKSDRNNAAMQDSWAALGCFFLLTAPSLGLTWKDTKLRTDIFEGISQLREISEIVAERDSYEVKIDAWIAEHLK